MLVPPKAKANLTRYLGEIARHGKPTVLHYLIVEIPDPEAAGHPRYRLMFEEARDGQPIPDMAFLRTYHGDPVVDDGERGGFRFLRGAVVLGGDRIVFVPGASGKNQVRGPAEVKKVLRALKGAYKDATSVPQGPFNKLREAKVLKARKTGDVVKEALDNQGRLDPVQKGGDFKRNKKAKHADAVKIQKAWEKLELRLKRAWDRDLPRQRGVIELALGDGNARRAKAAIKELHKQIDALLKPLSKVGGDIDTARADMRSSKLKKLRYADSLKATSRVEERIKKWQKLLSNLYNEYRAAERMAFSQQKMVPKASDLKDVRAKQDEVLIERQKPKKSLDRLLDITVAEVGRRKVRHKAAIAAVKEWNTLEAELARSVKSAKFRRGFTELEKLGKLKRSQPFNEPLDKTIRDQVVGLSREVERLEHKLSTFLKRLKKTSGKLRSRDLNEDDVAVLNAIVKRGRKWRKRLKDIQKHTGFVRLTESQAWSLSGAEKKGRSEQPGQRREAEKRWAKVSKRWDSSYTPQDLDTVLNYLRNPKRVGSNYRMDWTEGLHRLTGETDKEFKKRRDDQKKAGKKLMVDLMMDKGFLNLWQTGVSQASNDKRTRGRVEEQMGYKKALRRGKGQDGSLQFDPEDPSEMPLYAGVLSGAHTKGVAGRYGNTHVIWNDAIKKRITYTPGDSWSASRPKQGVQSFTSTSNPEGVFAHGDENLMRTFAAEATGKDQTWYRGEARKALTSGDLAPYVETQLHGDLSWEDVAEVIVDRKAFEYRALAGALRKFAKKKSYKFRVRVR